MQVAVLASGSSGNALLVSADDTHVLVDAGISARRIARELGAVGVEPKDVRAVLVTHEHGDHVSGLGPFVRRHGAPVYATPGTHSRIARLLNGGEKSVAVEAGTTFSIGGLTISAFSVSHDCVDPVGYSFTDGEARLAVATDLGVVGRNVRDHLSRADCVVLESNHDERMLLDGPYPWHLKRRILSNVGHLSNEAAAVEIDLLCDGGVSALILAHISRENNCPELAVETASRVLEERGRSGVEVIAAGHDRVTGPVDIRRGELLSADANTREGVGTVCTR